MFTQNYINFQHDVFFGLTSPNASLGGVVGRYLKSVANTDLPIYTSATLLRPGMGRCLNGYCKPLLESGASSYEYAGHGVYFGSGSTPATKDDYTLDSIIDSGLTIVTGSVFVTNETDGVYCVCQTYTLTNTTDADITIREIGCFMPAQTASAKFWQVLIERTVLTSPITIEPGESKSLTYKITFNQR